MHANAVLRQLRPVASFALLAALALTGCTAAAQSMEASDALLLGPATTATVTATTADDDLPAPTVPDPDALRTGPPEATIGRWYPYDLPTHCGIGNLEFSGRWWRLSQIRTGLAAGVDGPRIEWGDPRTPGYIRLESDRVAVFETAGQPPLVFEPVEAPTYRCR
ncbi:hypothetical protein [Streptomyces sp. NPDC006879]|uniref:hypothetical protein n=1 Tax=Streptomyces sp. NPDC006879 TaxID=3364767 RepID=UPI003681AD39